MPQFLYAFSYQLAVLVFVLIAAVAIGRRPRRSLVLYLLALAYLGGMFFGAHALETLVVRGSLTSAGGSEMWRWFGDSGWSALADPIGVVMALLRSGGGLWGGPLAVLAITAVFLIGLRWPLDDKVVMGDAAAVALPFALALCKLGCFSAGCCHGVEGDGWLYITDTWSQPDGAVRTCFPTQLLDATGYLVVGLVLAQLARRGHQRGRLLLWFTLLFAVVRFASELTRGDDHRMLVAGLSTVQWVLVVGAAGVTSLLARPALWQRLLEWRGPGAIQPAAGRYVAILVVCTFLWVPMLVFVPVFAVLVALAAVRGDREAVALRGACLGAGVMWWLSFYVPSMVPFLVATPIVLALIVAAFNRAPARA